MTTVEAMKHLICYIKNDGTTIDDITQTNATDLWEQIGLAFDARFNTASGDTSGGTTGSTGTLSALSVVSTLGETEGTTQITVSNATSADAIFRYATGNVKLPAYGEDLSAWESWDGVSEIVATDGMKICVAEVDSSNLAIAAGTTIINSNV